ncbi:MAG: diguanylate cyclase [Betaproteobacteria bacterium]|nr:diguanylate cyclase [Betaproteobacteria bacterium]
MRAVKTVPVGRTGSDEPWAPLIAGVRHSPHGCAVTSAEGVVLGCNAAWHSLLGRAQADCVGKPVESLLWTSGDLVEVGDAIGELNRTAAGALEFDARPVPPGNPEQCIGVSVTRIEPAEPVALFLWQITDSTRREQFEIRARQLEEVLQQSGDSIVVKDLNAVVTFWNREATSLYGFTPEEAIGHTLREPHAAELSEADYARVLARIRAGKPTASTAERRKKSGEMVRVANKTSPLTDAQGRLTGEITIARDVTAMHRAEESLRSAQASLESRLKAIREANRKLAREVASRRKTEEALRGANLTLESTVRQLESFNHDDEVLSRMAELLQSCAQRDEAYTVVRETARQLFPAVVGTLHIYRESRDVLEHVATWGKEQTPEPALAPDDCWALRLGRPHYVHSQSVIRCHHAYDATSCYVCMPVQGEGHVLGLLHLALDVGIETERPAETTDRRLRAMVDRLGPALANLKLRDSLRMLALHDALTGLYNRRYMEDALQRELRRVERSRKPLSLVMIDIDHFKRFNDTFGHDAGDYVLGAIAKVITTNVRSSDLACRYGGEELAVLLPEANLECAMARAEKLRLAIRELSLTHRGQTLPAPTASFGVAEYPVHGENLPEFLKAADRALYRAKEAGRDQVCAAEA